MPTPGPAASGAARPGGAVAAVPVTAPAGTDRAAAEGFAGLGPAAVRWLVLVLVAAVLAGVVPLALLQAVPDDLRSGAWRLTLAVMVWAGLRLAHRIAVGRPALFDFVFWLFVYIFMGLAPTAQMRADQPSTTTPGLDPFDDARIAALVLVGLACYEIGRAVARHGSSRGGALRGRAGDAAADGGAPPVDDAAAGGRDGERPVLDVVPRRAVVLTAVGVLAAAYFVTRIGFSTLFMSRYTAYDIRSERMPDVAVRSIVAAAGSYPLLVAAGVFLRIRATRALGALSTRYAPLLALAVVVLLTVVNPVSAARYDFGTVVFALAVMAGAAATVARGRVLMAAVVVGLLFVFPVADAFRSDAVNTSRNGFFGEYLANPDYDAFWQIGNAALYADSGLAQPLRQAAGVLLFWVPRPLWPDKPIDTGVLLAQYRGYSFENLSAPLWAELLVNGGLVALVLGFVLLGALLGRLDGRVSAALLGGGHLWAVVGGIFPIYMMILLRGSLLQATGTFVVAVACVLYVRARAAPRAAASA
ncbi:hypothetical protein J1G44_15505 [Cellulomonas sp. zg-ZUI199]|uniref:O-antigen polysaccharide polymerase Wzy n=1 Tax=Cellulomonas wangleii TaxID=2816956 RepID=A0ABX8D839_9CELL|nr:hypothetical protein [Cellulomonas wangleii]MBO0925885.1 hypothetical protein [Cellulomonas wangleii]QVI63198.1 hypothetical protein KG103_04640 [Cellulomonas wangleii]